jgi:probable rRNA maturation factor
MIQYRATGPLPRGVSDALLRRVALACGRVRGLPKGTAVIGIRFVSRTEIQKLNRIHRRMNKPTDVLSFSSTEGGAFPVGKEKEREAGDLVICPAYASVEAKRRSMSVVEELVRLIVHGTLHLAGMDHATLKDEEKMFALQERIIENVV